jgi:hypothetical protein
MFSKKPKQSNVGRNRVTQPVQRGSVFSYANSRSVRPDAVGRTTEQQELPRRSPRIPWLKRVPTLAALLLILVLGFAVLQLGNQPKVAIVGAAENRVFLRDRAAYEEAAHKLFTPFPNGNKLTVDAATIAADLKEQFPELAAVSVSLPVIGNRPVVYLQPASPKLILVTSAGMYLLDNNGRALIAGNQVSQLSKLHVPVVQDQSGLSVELGDVVLARTTVAFIEEVVSQLKAKHMTVTSLTLPAGTNEMHVRIKGAGYFVKFNLYGNAREQVGTFIAVKAYLKRSIIMPKQYIDVRVESKAYYK